MKKLTLYKRILVAITIFTILSIIIFTRDVISETKDWKFLDIDFTNKDTVVSSYGTLLGGILSFLSILFVMYGLLEQRHQTLKEQKNKEDDTKQELLDKLKLLSSFCKSSINEIIKQGSRMKLFYEAEKLNPIQMNQMYFTANKNFSRIIDMDSELTYKAFQLYFRDDSDWEKMFLNLYSTFDFYAEAMKDLQEKYKSQINYKVEEQRKINADLLKFLNSISGLIDDYLTNYGDQYLNYPWSNLVNNFTPKYYDYLEKCKQENKSGNLREISDNLLEPFIKDSLNLRQEYGYDIFGSRNLVNLASHIRKKIYENENDAKYYAEDIEKLHNEYFSENNSFIELIKNLKLKLDLVINEN